MPTNCEPNSPVNHDVPSGADNSARIWPDCLMGGLLMILVLVAYWPALQGGFIWDDDKYVTANPLLTDINGLQEIWFSTHTQSQYFPLVYTTLRIERQLWGLHPLGYHLVNILLHGINAVLVWLVLGRLRLPGAWLAAAIFALHPVNVESVAWVTELKNVESLCLSLLSVLAWLKFLEAPPNGPWWFYGLALGLAQLALFAKTTACTLPVALVLILWLRRERFTIGRITQIIPFVLLGLVMGLVSIWWEGNLGTYNEDAGPALNPLQRLLLAGRALWFYAGKLAWPVNLTFSYPHWELNPANPWQYLPLLGLAIVAAAVWRWRARIGRGPIAALLFFAATLTPLLGFIIDYTFRYSYVADHYQYVAAIGLFALLAAMLAPGLSKPGISTTARNFLAGVLLLILGGLTWRQCGVYQNPEALWRDTLAKNPQSWMAHYNLAMELLDQGRMDECIKEFHTTLALNPRHAKAQNNLGLALANTSRVAEAVDHYQAALQLDPTFVGAYNNLAVALAGQGNFAGAEVQLQKALQLDTNSPGLWLNLGDFLQQSGQFAKAIDCYHHTASLFPQNAEPWSRLADISFELSQWDDVVKNCRQALQRVPDRPDLLLKLGNAFAAAGDFPSAVGAYREAVKVQPNNAGIHYNLGLILAQQGQFDAARREFNETLKLQPDFSKAREQLLLLALSRAKKITP